MTDDSTEQNTTINPALVQEKNETLEKRAESESTEMTLDNNTAAIPALVLEKNDTLERRAVAQAEQAQDEEEDEHNPLGQDESRLSRKQQIYLSTVAELADEEAFEQRDPKLTEETLHPIIAQIPDEEFIEDDEFALPPPKSDNPILNADPTLLDQIGPQLTHAGMLELTGETQIEAIGLHEEETHALVGYEPPPKPFRLQDLPIEAKIAIGVVALAIPLFSMAIWRQASGDAELDKVQQQQLLNQTKASGESHSLAYQPETTYRQPAPVQRQSFGGSLRPTGGPSSASETEEDLVNWHPRANKLPEPTPEQIAEGRKHIEAADKMLAVGQTSSAAAYLSAALGKCPANVSLRVATIKAYIALKRYKTARAICVEGMRNARTAGDFDILKTMLAQVPSA